MPIGQMAAIKAAPDKASDTIDENFHRLRFLGLATALTQKFKCKKGETAGNAHFLSTLKNASVSVRTSFGALMCSRLINQENGLLYRFLNILAAEMVCAKR